MTFEIPETKKKYNDRYPQTIYPYLLLFLSSELNLHHEKFI